MSAGKHSPKPPNAQAIGYLGPGLHLSFAFKINLRTIMSFIAHDRGQVIGIDIRIQTQSDEPPVTVVAGAFKVQPALAGALSHLCDLGLPLLSVELIAKL